jgi:hypothetical protein
LGIKLFLHRRLWFFQTTADIWLVELAEAEEGVAEDTQMNNEVGGIGILMEPRAAEDGKTTTRMEREDEGK